jgi:hypothetical protein
MPISKQEFARYISKFDNYRISLMKLYVEHDSFHLVVYLIDQYGNYNHTSKYVASKHPTQANIMMTNIIHFEHNDIIKLPDMYESFIFAQSGYDMLTFDVKTVCNILTSRGKCPDIIKNYAKNLTLKMFDNWIAKLSYNQALTLINLYLFGTANALGIERNYYDLASATCYMDPQQTHKYTRDTEQLRNELINAIR